MDSQSSAKDHRLFTAFSITLKLFSISLISVSLMFASYGCSIKSSKLLDEPITSTSTTEDLARENKLRDLEYVAASLVGVLAQLDDFEPLSITVQATPPVSEYGEALLRELRRVGYGVQRVVEDQGRNYISYARTEIISDEGFIVQYSLTINDAVVARQFVESDSSISPVSPFLIEGVKPQEINSGFDPFVRADRVAEPASGVAFELEDGSEVIQGRSGRKNSPRGRRYYQVSELLEFNTADKIDVGEYKIVKQIRVTFPTSDDRILGKGNKQLLWELASSMMPDREILTLAGCFHSSPGTERERRSLAWMKRISEEFVSAGVDRKQIRLIACPGSDGNSQLPEQFVVVTLRRLRATNQ